jgi:putative FmdB family regulatory protein
MVCSEEGPTMPSYEFECQSCHVTVTLVLSIHDREAGTIKCPNCGGTNVQQRISSFMVKTSKKS